MAHHKDFGPGFAHGSPVKVECPLIFLPRIRATFCHFWKHIVKQKVQQGDYAKPSEAQSAHRWV
jgi:hypothetical protein